MKPLTLLKRAKKRIEKGWCQREYAVGAAGVPCGPRNPAAVSWCAVGALEACTQDWLAIDTCRELLEESLLKGATQYLQIFNDRPGITKEDVINLYNRAIKKADERI